MTHLAVLRAFDGRPPVGRHAVHRGRGGVRLAHPPRVPAGAPRRRWPATSSSSPTRATRPSTCPPSRPACAGWWTSSSRCRCWSAPCTPACSAARSATPSPRCAARWRGCTTSTATSPSPASSTARRRRRTSTRPRSAATPGVLFGVALIGRAASWSDLDQARGRRARHRRAPRRRGVQHPHPPRPGQGQPAPRPRRRRHHRAEGPRRAPRGERAVGRARHGHAGRGRRRAVLAVGRRRRVRRRPPHLRGGLRQRGRSRSASAGRSRSSPSSRGRSRARPCSSPASGIRRAAGTGSTRAWTWACSPAACWRRRSSWPNSRDNCRRAALPSAHDRSPRARPHVPHPAGAVVAVAGVDIDVAPGELVGFLGPNGAGKTTTLRMLTTLLRPTAGSATVGGPRSRHRSRRGAPQDRLRGAERRRGHRLPGRRGAGRRRRGSTASRRRGRPRAPPSWWSGSTSRAPSAGSSAPVRWPAASARHRAWGSSTCRGCCSSTSRPRGSIRRAAPTSGSTSAACTPSTAPPLPHHPLPRRGRCAVRPHPRHRPGPRSSPRARPMR